MKLIISLIFFLTVSLSLLVVDGENQIKELTESNNRLKQELVQSERYVRFLESQNKMLMEEME